MLLFGLVAAMIAGLYGVLHDQVTFSLGPEYFTQFKVWQFGYQDHPGPERWMAVRIGFQASWAAGFFAGWFFARVTLPASPWRWAAAWSFRAAGLMLAVTIAGGLSGWAWAKWRRDESRLEDWAQAFQAFGITDKAAFYSVGCIHNGSYAGALLGLVTALVWLHRRTRTGPNATQPS